MKGMCQPVANSLAELAARGGYMTPTCGLALKNLYNSDTQIYVTMTDYELTFNGTQTGVNTVTTTASPVQGGAPRGVINGYPSQSPAYTPHNIVGLVRDNSNNIASAWREATCTETGKYKFTILSA